MIRSILQLIVYFVFWLNALCIFWVSNTLANVEDSISWAEADCEFNIINYDEKIKGDTLLGVLIKESGWDINLLLERDQKIIKLFEIRYKASVKLQNDAVAHEREIKQIGLYKALHPKIRAHIKEQKMIKIKYALNDPIMVRFIINNEPIAAPTMMTSTIDDKWKNQ